ncbi:MAG TPA: hypothetical protein VFA17_08535 [Thermoplasmata archaeon]|nr:hypothetical protein [Thermoplasmata archaeon]
MRTLETGLGLFAVLVGFAVLGFLDADVPALQFWLAATLLLLGLRELARGIASLRTLLGIFEAGAGLTTVVLAFLVAVFPGFGVATLFGFLFLGLFAYGGSQIGVGLSEASMPPWSRGYLMAVGWLNLLPGPLLQLMPGQPRLTFVLLASVALVVDGIALLVVAGGTVDRGRPDPSEAWPTRRRYP